MKKLLLASTAVVMSAGVAAADVALSGDAWMGLTYTNAVATNKIQMKSRARVTFTLSGETDGGMAFGGSFRADNASGAAAGSAGSVFISGDFGRLAMGDVDSALEATWFRTRHIGVLENAGGSRASALGSGPHPRALYTYSIDGFTVAAGAGQITSGAQSYSLGASYTMDGYGIAIGGERDGANNRHIMISGQATFDTISVRAFASQLRASSTGGGISGVAAGDKGNQYGADVSATFDATTVQLRLKRDFAGNNHIGAGAVYNLGGGARLGASVNRVSGGATTADLGLAFSF